MRFIPHTEADVVAMLETIGVAHLDDLVAHVPEKLRAIAAINLASGMDEAEVAAEVTALAARNSGALDFVSFLCGGHYPPYFPAPARGINPRAQYPTRHTPSQPHRNQGATHVLFDVQTLLSH